MLHEISQLDIPDRQLIKAGDQQRVSFSKEIGEATITHTIFGKAKVRIVRKYDHLRRALLLFAAAVLAVVAWRIWLASQPESQQSADSLPTESEMAPDSLPAAKPGIATPPAAVSATESKPIASPANVIAKPVIIQKSAPQPVAGMKGPAPAKPVPPKPLPVVRPGPAPAVTKPPVVNQMSKPLPTRQEPPKPAVAPVVVPPRVISPPAQTATSAPAAVVPLAAPARVELAPPVQAPAIDKPLSAPIGSPAQ